MGPVCRFAVIAEVGARAFPLARRLPPWLAGKVAALLPPVVAARVQLVSPSGRRAEGSVIGVAPASPRRRGLPAARQWGAALRLAARRGADVVGMARPGAAAPAARVPTPGETPVTTGVCFGVAAALVVLERMLGQRGLDSRRVEHVVLADDDPLTMFCCRMLARRARQVTLVGARASAERLAGALLRETGLVADPAGESRRALERGVAVLAAGAAGLDGMPLDPAWLPPGAVVCDLSPARALAERVGERPDVTALTGAVVRLPDADGAGPVWPAEAAEAAVLAVAGREAIGRWGRDRLDVERAEALIRLADEHGFRLTGARYAGCSWDEWCSGMEGSA